MGTDGWTDVTGYANAILYIEPGTGRNSTLAGATIAGNRSATAAQLHKHHQMIGCVNVAVFDSRTCTPQPTPEGITHNSRSNDRW